MLCKTDQALTLQSLLLPVVRTDRQISNHSPGSLWNINLELLASPWILHNQSEPLNKEDTRLGLPTKFDSSRFFIRYGTTECIFQTNSEPTMPILWSRPRDRLLSVLPGTLTNCIVLAFSSFIQLFTATILPSQSFPLGLHHLFQGKSNPLISSKTSLFALSKSCLSCSPLKDCLFFH